MVKAQDAANYKAAGYPVARIADYPYVRAEGRSVYGAAPTEAQYREQADMILSSQAAWAAKGADIEEQRRAGKVVRDGGSHA